MHDKQTFGDYSLEARWSPKVVNLKKEPGPKPQPKFPRNSSGHIAWRNMVIRR